MNIYFVLSTTLKISFSIYFFFFWGHFAIVIFYYHLRFKMHRKRATTEKRVNYTKKTLENAIRAGNTSGFFLSNSKLSLF